MNKLLLSTLAVAAAAVTLVSCSRESTPQSAVQDVSSITTFKLGLDDSFPPMGYRDENGEIVGFDIDTAREVCARLGVELVAQPIDWNAKEQELATGNIDCIWNGFTVTDERREQMLFSDPYVDNAQVIVVRGDSPAEGISDLEGATIGVQAGSSAQDAINDTPGFVDTIGEVIEFKENLTALMDLEIGGCDAVVMDLLVANDNIKRSGSDFRILDETLVKEEYAIGFRKGDVALRDAVQNELNAMAADGTLAEIATKWFGADITVVGK